MSRQSDTVELPRREKALALAKQGATYQQIADECGYSDKASAWRSVMTSLRKEAVDGKSQELRALLFARRESAHRALARRALVEKDDSAMRLYLSNLDGTAKLLGLNVNEARLAGAAEVTAVADLAAASMLQAALIGTLHEVGLPVETIDRIIGLLNARMGAQDQGVRSDDELTLAGEVEP